MFSAQGAIGKAVRVNTLTGGQRFSLAAAATAGPAGDTAFFAWVDDSTKGADKTGRAIEGRVLPIPAAGSRTGLFAGPADEFWLTRA